MKFEYWFANVKGISNRRKIEIGERFPELEELVSSLHIVTVYSLLSEFPSAAAIATAHLTRLSNIIYESSQGQLYGARAPRFQEWFDPRQALRQA